LLLHLGKIIA